MILVDLNEPEDIIKLLKQSCPVVVSPLNNLHMSDYFFAGYSGETFQFSRKQAAELLGNVDEAEDQIRDYYEKADHNFQIVEGIISPVPLAIPTEKQLWSIRSGKVAWQGKVMGISTRASDKDEEFNPAQPPLPRTTHSYGYKVEHLFDKNTSNRYAITHGHSFNTAITLYYAWRHRLEMAGVPTYETLNSVETAKLLSTIYHNEQKPPEEHSTLQRIIRPRIQIKEQDPFIKALCFLSSAYRLDVGEKRAKALAEKFVNIFDLALASVDDIASVEGIGVTTAVKIRKALRGD